ncbi:hypothetical protein DM02DRAFT_608509 [Periconia macrospinosa]|uniref:Transmembrane protein n=1 Tax=Periconia macrospinosa TaxID=97972 RepID=A0A2V1EEM8_9PLEO|nr:hypothetical protein DM02DRAFT_608509 [Periconia macrospinosa]
MRPLAFGLSLVAVSLCYATASSTSDIPLDCAGRRADADEDRCHEPLKAVTSVVPGEFYVAKLPCLGCPVARLSDGKKEVKNRENELLFNISLSYDSRALYLNDKLILPALPTTPTPPTITTSQITPNFTRAHLDNWVQCTLEDCEGKHCSCMNSFASDTYLSEVNLDYDFYSHILQPYEEDRIQWEVTFDAIGGRDILPNDPVWKANNTKQSMLRIVVQGKELKENTDNPQTSAGGGSLFETPDQPTVIVYEYTIVSVELSERSYRFDTPTNLGFFGRIRRYFGLDIIRSDGHIVYLQEEWGWYGKEGSLRNQFGYFVHEWPWAGIFITIGSIFGGLIALWLAYKLFIIAKQQRELARWDGIDTVWANLRRDSNNGDEEEDRLMSGGGYRDEGYSDGDGDGASRYRDEPDEEGSIRYTDEVLTNKPLPTKPLPEKPLPAVPLIDA